MPESRNVYTNIFMAIHSSVKQRIALVSYSYEGTYV